MREGRRIIGRPSWGQPQGFTVWEIDISADDYNDDYYRQTLLPEIYRRLKTVLAGLEATAVMGTKSLEETTHALYDLPRFCGYWSLCD